MARGRSKKLATGGSKPPRADEPTHDDREASEGEAESVDFDDKSDDEMDLDRLVFGDATPFNQLIGTAAAQHDEDSEHQGSEDEEGDDMAQMADADLFFLDDTPGAMPSSALVVQQQPDQDEHDGNAPAWEDSDDDRLAVSLADHSRLRKLRVAEGEDVISGREYIRRLRKQFIKLHPAPEWASYERLTKRRRRSSAHSDSSRDSDEMSMDEEDISTLPLARLLQDANALTKSSTTTTTKRKLRAEVLDIQRTRGIAKTLPSSVNSLSFHPQFPVILSSGPASTLFLHHIDVDAHPEPNPLLTSVHIRSTPLTTSAFHADGKKVFFAGRRRYFHTWDLETGVVQKVTRVYGQKDEQKLMERFKLSPCGRYLGLIGTGAKGGGVINILDAATCQWIASARIESRGGVADFAWWRDGEGLTIAGKSGEIGEWSMKQRSFVGHWNDAGAIGTTVIALGGRSTHAALGGNRWVAIGSSSGVVNIYDRRPWTADNLPNRPEPTKTFMQLTTETNCITFSPDGQIMAFSSKQKKDALRLVHLPSCTVFRNWPTSNTPLGRVTAIAFDKDSELLAVGNDAGKIRLWEIRA